MASLLTLLTIFLLNQIRTSLSQACPSTNYVQCALEGNTCEIADTVEEGYMSYGVGGRWTLIPFTNSHTDGTDLEIKCDNNHGDPQPGSEKYCCYIETDTGINLDSFAGSINEGKKSTNEWEFDDTSIIYTMRYGTGSRYVYRVINGATGYCRNSFFNDPASGTRKVCNYAESAPSSIPESSDDTEDGWTICANEGNDCTGLDKTAAQWVKYGDNDKYYFRLIISSVDGKIPCNNDLFGDPISGEAKACYRSPAQFTFPDMVGQWTELPSCLACASNEYSIGLGVTELTEQDITTAWEASISTTVSHGFEFELVSSSIELSATVSNSIANRMLTSFSQTYTETSTFTCEKDALYQWTMSATEDNGISTLSFAVRSEDFACMDNGNGAPKCPPGYCSDDDCQICTESLN